MEVNIARLKPLIDELRMCRSELNRLTNVIELIAQKHFGLTTQIVVASKSDLEETKVDYTDPDFATLLLDTERRLGRMLSEEEQAKIFEVLKMDDEDRS